VLFLSEYSSEHPPSRLFRVVSDQFGIKGAEDDKHDENQHRRRKGDTVKPESCRDPDARDGPHGRGGRKSANRPGRLDDRTRAQETDALDDDGGETARIRRLRPLQRDGYPAKRHGRGTQPDQGVCANSGWLMAHFAFHADEAA